MSAIDSFEHAHVGKFFGLPIYWVLNESHNNQLSHLTDCSSDDGVIIDQYSLSVGGGSGEHPALIFNNDAAIFHFLLNLEEVNPPTPNATNQELLDYKIYQLAQEIENKYYDRKHEQENDYDEICYWTIDQNQWPLETFIGVAKKWGSSNDNTTIAENMIQAIALFIINEMPLKECIKDKDLVEFAKNYKTLTQTNLLKQERKDFLSVAVSKIKEDQKCGKIIRNNQVIWGYSLKDWQEDNMPLIEKEAFDEKISNSNIAKKIKI